jgi:alkyl sulfatase BDS1-like metallo-beta-lactamase superfamily hydrolase
MGSAEEQPHARSYAPLLIEPDGQHALAPTPSQIARHGSPATERPRRRQRPNRTEIAMSAVPGKPNPLVGPFGPALAQPATEATRACQHAARRWLPLTDRRSFDDAWRGHVADLPPGAITRASGAPVWNLAAYGFLADEQAPDSVHPGLWRHARVNMITGLFKVCDRLYQVRGFDISNMTLIEGDSGLIVVDPLVSTEVARAALELYYAHRPRRPVVAVVYSHSHVDHFGGVRGVVDEADVLAGRVQVIAPQGFMEETVAENVMAGNAMLRRSLFQFGPLLPKGIRGQVDAGLGKTTSTGTVTLIPPTRVITQTVEHHVIDGIACVFELTPGAEAPSELIIHHPGLRVLNMTEITSHNFHNLLPLRGAQVRDALAWSHYLDGALQRYGAGSDILIAQHHWPVWGGEAVDGFLRRQRDLYKYVHDQTLRWMNHGLLAGEIAERLQLPQALLDDWACHGFYGSVKHNVKAVVQRYIGWYDANPANLDPLPPAATARKTIAYMGGAQAVLQRARDDFDQGDYRWVAQICQQLAHAGQADEPAVQLACALGADALEQLGYQAESATWRNAYLQAALELRHGPPQLPVTPVAVPDLVRAMPLGLFFDYLAMRLDGAKAEGRRLRLNWCFSDTGERLLLNLEHSALTHRLGVDDPDADATVTLTRSTLDEIALLKLTFADALQAGRIQVAGQASALLGLLGMFDTFGRMFPVVGPRPALATA